MQAIPMGLNGMKQCKTCKNHLDESEFYKCKSYKDGLTYDCKKCRKEYYDKYYLKFPKLKEIAQAKQKVAHQKQQVIINERARIKWRKERELCIKHYGGICDCCGEDRYEFLAVDHINGGGNRERKKYSRNGFVKYLIDNKFPAGYRILCHNCNMAIGFYGYCPHQEIQKETE